MNHYTPIILENARKTKIYYSKKPAKKLIIFVHGFVGKATKTWDDFPDLVHDYNQFADCDIVFFGYNSLKSQANRNAILFKDFMLAETNHIRQQQRMKSFGIPYSERAYDKIILVAHSLGAIIVRRAMLFINSEVPNHRILNISKMVLFAPAHRGTTIRESYLTALPGLMVLIGISGLIAIPVLQNLQPDSGTIQDLIRDSNVARGIEEHNHFTIAHTVVWADRDIIVHQDVFDPRESPKVPNGTTHTSVCSPKGHYLDPIQFVINALN